MHLDSRAGWCHTQLPAARVRHLQPRRSFPPGFADKQLSLASGWIGIPDLPNPLRVIAAEASGAGSIGPKVPTPERAVAVDELLLCFPHQMPQAQARPAVKAEPHWVDGEIICTLGLRSPYSPLDMAVLCPKLTVESSR